MATHLVVALLCSTLTLLKTLFKRGIFIVQDSLITACAAKNRKWRPEVPFHASRTNSCYVNRLFKKKKKRRGKPTFNNAATGVRAAGLGFKHPSITSLAACSRRLDEERPCKKRWKRSTIFKKKRTNTADTKAWIEPSICDEQSPYIQSIHIPRDQISDKVVGKKQENSFYQLATNEDRHATFPVT